MLKKILITGAAGFIGSRFFHYLKKKNYKIFGVDFGIFKNKDSELYELDLTNLDKKNKLINNIKPDFIFHLAAFAGPPRNEIYPDKARKYNVELVKTLLKDLDKSIPIFFPSTDKIFSGLEYPNEDVKLNPDNLHGKLKVECEKLIREHSPNHFIIRQPVVHSYGGYKRNTEMSGPGSFIDKAVDDIINKKNVETFSNVKRCFVSIDDLMVVYEKLVNSNKYGTYNIASPMTSYYDRIKKICEFKKINYTKYLIPVIGKINPLEQNINSSKFNKIFQLQLT